MRVPHKARRYGAGAVLLHDLDLAAEEAAHRVDLVDRQALGLDRAGLADGHGAGGRMQLADGDFGVGHGELVVLTSAVGNCCAKLRLGNVITVAAARPSMTLRRWSDLMEADGR